MDVEDDPDLRELSFNDTVKRTVWKTFKVTIKFPQPQKKKKKTTLVIHSFSIFISSRDNIACVPYFRPPCIVYIVIIICVPIGEEK